MLCRRRRALDWLEAPGMGASMVAASGPMHAQHNSPGCSIAVRQSVQQPLPARGPGPLASSVMLGLTRYSTSPAWIVAICGRAACLTSALQTPRPYIHLRPPSSLPAKSAISYALAVATPSSARNACLGLLFCAACICEPLARCCR